MRRAFLALFTSLFLILQASLGAQLQVAGSSASAAQATTLLAQASKALIGSAVINDVTLAGIAHRIAGSDDETGSTTLRLMSNGSTKLAVAYSSGTRSEIRSMSGSIPTGSWTDPDGTSHQISPHNLMFDGDWYVPALPIARLILSSESIANYIDNETLGTQTVAHIVVQKNVSYVPVEMAPLFLHLSETHIFLDTSTSLPVAIRFNLHPESNALEDVPAEIRFSDYRTVNGVQVPFHVQKYINNGLVLDLQFSNAQFNSGLSAADFSVQ
jgi:hypothetical protein